MASPAANAPPPIQIGARVEGAVTLSGTRLSGAWASSASKLSRSAANGMVKSLAQEPARSSGRLHEALFGRDYPRGAFERLLGGLHRAGMIHIEDASFEQDGELIEYQRPVITASGRRASAEDLEKVRLPMDDEGGDAPRRRRRSSSGRRKKSGRKKGSRRGKGARKRS